MDTPKAPETLVPSIHELVRLRARTHHNVPILSYPDFCGGYVDYNGEDVDRMTMVASATYATMFREISLTKSRNSTIQTVAMIGASNLEYYISFIALQRLGISSMFLSTRLSNVGFEHLLRSTDCTVVLASKPFQDRLEQLGRLSNLELHILPMLKSLSPRHLLRSLEPWGYHVCGNGIQIPGFMAQKYPNFVIHSGGTTGLPKPVTLSSQDWIAQAMEQAKEMPDTGTLSTLPLFHSFGLVTLLRALVAGRKLALLNAERPITAEEIIIGLNKTQSGILVTVPFALKFIIETPFGMERLARLQLLVAAGSATPDGTGDRLVSSGVKLFQLYGLTECGALMRPSGYQWNWLVPLPHAEPYLRFEPVDDSRDLYHLIVLPGLPGKVFSNRSDGSYGTKDLFHRHQKDPRRWKFAARLDDLIVLSNGEKVDPTPLEAAVCKSRFVKTAVVFGAQRDSLGMVVICSELATNMTKEEVIAAITPELERGNSIVARHERVFRNALIVKDVSNSYPVTDKATVIRSRFIEMFSNDIDAYYAASEIPRENRFLTQESIRALVRQTVQDQLQLCEDLELDDFADFFSLGMDSLQATNVRSKLIKEVNCRGAPLPTNVVFDKPNVARLTAYLVQATSSLEPEKEDISNLARALIERYSNFRLPRNGFSTVKDKCVLLTGVTGFLGSHILHVLLQSKDIKRVICLVRANDSTTAVIRVHEALDHARLLHLLPPGRLDKITALPANLGDEYLGLSEPTYDEVAASITSIIHSAWSVNFNMALSSFEPQDIRGISHLIGLALRSPYLPKPTFCFISSLAAVLRATQHPVPECPQPAAAAAAMGYGQSKHVAEELCAAAARKVGLDARIIRLGQLAGDTRHGVWNTRETIPMTVQTAFSIGTLPKVQTSTKGCGGDLSVRWLPVDVAAKAVVELTALTGDTVPRVHESSRLTVFHVAQRTPMMWNRDFLPALRHAGLSFAAVPQQEWLRRVEQCRDIDKNPAFKLLEFFKEKYGTVPVGPEVNLDISVTSRFSASLCAAKGISEDLVQKFVENWTREWGAKFRSSV